MYHQVTDAMFLHVHMYVATSLHEIVHTVPLKSNIALSYQLFVRLSNAHYSKLATFH